MTSISIPARSTEVGRRSASPFLWGLRVAVLLALFDILLADGMGAAYYDRVVNRPFALFGTRSPSDVALTGQVLLLVGSVLIAMAFPYLLAQRPLWFRRRTSTLRFTPSLAAVSATATIFVAWSLLVVVLALATGFIGEVTFKYAAPIMFLLLLHAVASTYAGFVAANGDRTKAQRAGGIAGLVCGLAAAVAWAVADGIYAATGSQDQNYALYASIARIIAFGAIGYVAGRQGGALWVASGVGAPKPTKVAKAADLRPARRGFRLNAGTIWAAVGLLLIALFFAPTTQQAASNVASRLAGFAGSAVAIWVGGAIIGIVLVALGLGLRAAWPSLAPARHALWQGILYVLALGGAGTRLRSLGARRLLISLGLVFLLFWPHIDSFILGNGSDARTSILADTGYYVILALGLNIVVGFAGLLDLGYVAFFAFGAYTWSMLGASQFKIIVDLFHRLSHFPLIPQQLPGGLNWAWLFWPTLLLGALVAAGFGVLLGAPTLRLRGDYLAIVTLGFGEIVPIAFRNVPGLTSGTNGINGVPSPYVPGVEFPIFGAIPYYYIILLVIGVVIVCNLRLRDSRLGRAWVALREDEIATAAAGVNTVRTKLLAFGAGAFFSGMAGAYHASKLGVITPGDFSFSDSIIYLAMVVLGGIGSIPGVMVGAVVIALLNIYILPTINSSRTDPTSLFYVFHNFDVSYVRFIIFGLLLVGMMLLRPEGLIPNRRRQAELHGEVAAETEAPVLDALDAAIGGPAYQEDRVV